MTKRSRTPFQNTIALLTVGLGLITLGVAAMALITMKQGQIERENPSTVVPVAADYPAPALTLSDLDGNPRSLADLRGQVVLVNLWATWCPPCVEELPTLNSFYNDHADQGFVIIGIDDGEDLATVKEFLTRIPLNFPIWMDPEYKSESAFVTMNLPSSYVLDRNGQVRLQWVGAITRQLLNEYIIPIIEE